MKTETAPSGDHKELPSNLSIAFCGGGSGGHLTPSLAVMNHLKTQLPHSKLQFLFLCSGREIDRTVLRRQGVEGSVRNPSHRHEDDVNIILQSATSTSDRLAFMKCLFSDFRTCRSALKQHQPDLVIGTGGFASVAPILAARSLGHQPLLLEPNAVPGQSTRWLSRLAASVLCGWPMSDDWIRKIKSPVVEFGIPVTNVPPETPSDSDGRPVLLIAGGSLGAQQVNDLAATALANNASILRGWTIIHQTGPQWQPTVEQQNACRDLKWHRHPFVPDLSSKLYEAEVFISRAGAITLAEIVHSQTASILVPLSTSADNHQAANADVLSEAEAAKVIDEVQPAAATDLSKQLDQLITNKHHRSTLQNGCRALVKHISTPEKTAAGLLEFLS